MNITFFGHRDARESIASSLENTLTQLIMTYSPINFYIGNQGNFDSMVQRILANLSQAYPQIKLHIVLAYIPTSNSTVNENSIFPDGLEFVPRKYAIYKRNEWMLQKSDVVITHVISPTGGAAKFKEKAEKMGKTVINITK